MICFMAKVAETTGNPFTLRADYWAVEDDWTHKDLRNYDVFQDNRYEVIPNHYNKIPEHTVWKMNQPGYMRSMPQKYLGKAMGVFTNSSKTVAWDGTWNMPLEGLAHKFHKDAKYTDFITA
jgi:hypothetical protein